MTISTKNTGNILLILVDILIHGNNYYTLKAKRNRLNILKLQPDSIVIVECRSVLQCG